MKEHFESESNARNTNNITSIFRDIKSPSQAEESLRFLLRSHSKLQSQVILLQETVFALQSRLYEIEQIQGDEK